MAILSELSSASKLSNTRTNPLTESQKVRFFATTDSEVLPEDVVTAMTSAFELSVDSKLAHEGCEFVETDRDLEELCFAMSEKYQAGKVEGLTRLYEVEVEFVVKSLTRNKNV